MVKSFAQDALPAFAQEQIDWLQVAVYLKKQLETGNIEQQRDALFQIRNLRSEQASRLAIPALTDSNEIVRATAASSVVYLPSEQTAGLLIPLLNDKSAFVRREAAYALGKAGSRNATAPLLQIVQRDKDLEVRNAAVVALGGIGDVIAIAALNAILTKKPKEDDEFLRRSVARSIGQIAQIIQSGKTKVLTPQNFLPSKFKDVEAPKYPNLIEQHPIFRSSIITLTNVLKNRNESDDTRREAAFALGAIGDDSAISILNSNINSEDPYLAEIAKEALLKIKL